ncbi:hypothetical protein L4C33_15270 [Vibrio makurazakiensis]|uniref:hypothetical protein n=1 Tax=Vibrio makurazakiensis TaxID=2910250 RepID=UPI003D0EAA2C
MMRKNHYQQKKSSFTPIVKMLFLPPMWKNIKGEIEVIKARREGFKKRPNGISIHDPEIDDEF